MAEVPSKPKIVVMCGSSRHIEVMAVCGWLIEKNEQAAVMGLHLLPGWYSCSEIRIASHLAEAEGVAEQMDALHLRKIEMADEVFVVNLDHYVGESTRREVEHAKSLGKPIRWYTHDPIGDEAGKIMMRAFEALAAKSPLGP